MGERTDRLKKISMTETELVHKRRKEIKTQKESVSRLQRTQRLQWGLWHFLYCALGRQGGDSTGK